MISANPGVQDLIDQFPGGYWSDHDSFKDWQDEAANNYTRLGFWEWLHNKINLEEPKNDE